ncbi:MAG: ester cyclase [Chloroflexi bacterium]|nr:ester cyclase [Chloroflexota bacterium]
MAIEDNAARMRRLIETGIGQGDLTVIEELLAPDCVEHQRGNNPGRDGAVQVATTLHRWMSEFTLTVEDIAVAGDVVWTRNRARGVNTGSVMGNPPTGKPVEVDVIDICRFQDGLVIEHWGIADQVGLLLQVGAMPPRR